MATSLTAWGPEIRPDVVGLPTDALKLAVRKACQKFCEKTLLWTYTIDRVSVVADTADYTLTVPSSLYAEIVGTARVMYKTDGADDDQFRKLPPISEILSDLGGDVGSSDAWKYATASEPSNHWMDIIDQQLHLYPIPEDASTEGLLIKLYLKPDGTTDEVQDFLFRDHSETIAKGALEYLFARKNTPWYDLEESLKNGAQFNSEINRAIWKRVHGGTPDRQSKVRMREFI